MQKNIAEKYVNTQRYFYNMIAYVHYACEDMARLLDVWPNILHKFACMFHFVVDVVDVYCT